MDIYGIYAVFHFRRRMLNPLITNELHGTQ